MLGKLHRGTAGLGDTGWSAESFGDAIRSGDAEPVLAHHGGPCPSRSISINHIEFNVWQQVILGGGAGGAAHFLKSFKNTYIYIYIYSKYILMTQPKIGNEPASVFPCSQSKRKLGPISFAWRIMLIGIDNHSMQSSNLHRAFVEPRCVTLSTSSEPNHGTQHIFAASCSSCCLLILYSHMGMSINSGMDRSAVIRTMDRECLRKVPDPYPFVRAHHSIQTVLILLLSPTCYYFSSCYSCC